MSPEDLSDLLRTKPFQPFRLHMTDGSSFDVWHPEGAVPTRRVLILGMGGDPSSGVFDRAVQLTILHVVRVEPLEVPSKGNGQAGAQPGGTAP